MEKRDPDLIALEYLLTGSQTSLENALLTRLNAAAELKKEIDRLLEAWADARAEALLLAWFRRFGPELVARIETPPRKPGPQRMDLRKSLRDLLDEIA